MIALVQSSTKTALEISIQQKHCSSVLFIMFVWPPIKFSVQNSLVRQLKSAEWGKWRQSKGFQRQYKASVKNHKSFAEFWHVQFFNTRSRIGTTFTAALMQHVSLRLKVTIDWKIDWLRLGHGLPMPRNEKSPFNASAPSLQPLASLGRRRQSKPIAGLESTF